jgi:membrane protein YqaA with SNARE-associated domain
MELFGLIFFNSLIGHFFLSFQSESMWEAAVLFGKDIHIVIPAAVLGSTIGFSINFFLGYLLSIPRHKIRHFNEDNYEHCALYGRRYGIYALLFSAFWFMPAVAFGVGFLRAGPARCCLLIFIGRVLYYQYALHHI